MCDRRRRVAFAFWISLVWVAFGFWGLDGLLVEAAKVAKISGKVGKSPNLLLLFVNGVIAGSLGRTIKKLHPHSTATQTQRNHSLQKQPYTTLPLSKNILIQPLPPAI